MIDDRCGKFGDCCFIQSFGFRADRQTEADERFTPASMVGASNNTLIGLLPSFVCLTTQNFLLKTRIPQSEQYRGRMHETA